MKKRISLLVSLFLFTSISYSQICSETFTGEGTFYGYGGGGNCSFAFDGKPAITGAMNQIQYDSSSICGACVEVTGSKGTLIISIEDRCPECKYGDIDLSEDAFPYIDDKIKGRVPISWRIVPCPVTGPVKFYIKEGSSQWWTAVQVRNHKYPIEKFEYKVNGNWVNVKRMMYNYFLVQTGMGTGPYDFRITDLNGSVIVEENIPLIVTTEIVGKNQFPDCNDTTQGDLVKSVQVSPESASLKKGQTIQLNATILPLTAINKKVKWSSDNPPVATVSANGLVSAIMAGKANVTVTTAEGGKTAVCVLEITGGGSGSCDFRTPVSQPLPGLNKQFKYVHVIGVGPSLANITNLTMNWDKESNGLWQFSVNTNNGKPDWYVDLRTFSQHSFNQNRPEITFSGSGIPGLDGQYFVAINEGDFVMVSKNAGFSVYFSNSAMPPVCQKNAVISNFSGVDNIKVYPIPFKDLLTVELNLEKGDVFKKLELVSSTGQIIHSYPNTAFNGELLEIELDNKYNILLLRIFTAKKVYVKKVLNY